MSDEGSKSQVKPKVQEDSQSQGGSGSGAAASAALASAPDVGDSLAAIPDSATFLPWGILRIVEGICAIITGILLHSLLKARDAGDGEPPEWSECIAPYIAFFIFLALLPLISAFLMPNTFKPMLPSVLQSSTVVSGLLALFVIALLTVFPTIMFAAWMDNWYDGELDNNGKPGVGWFTFSIWVISIILILFAILGLVQTVMKGGQGKEVAARALAVVALLALGICMLLFIWRVQPRLKCNSSGFGSDCKGWSYWKGYRALTWGLVISGVVGLCIVFLLQDFPSALSGWALRIAEAHTPIILLAFVAVTTRTGKFFHGWGNWGNGDGWRKRLGNGWIIYGCILLVMGIYLIVAYKFLRPAA